MATRVGADLTCEESAALRCVYELESYGGPPLLSLKKIRDEFWSAESVGAEEARFVYIPLWGDVQRGVQV